MTLNKMEVHEVMRLGNASVFANRLLMRIKQAPSKKRDATKRIGEGIDIFKENTIKLGIAPIAWTNDALPELGGENTFEQCVSEMALGSLNSRS